MKQRNHTVSSSDVVVVLTPEYNHSIPGELKNALSLLAVSERRVAQTTGSGSGSYTASGTGGSGAGEYLVQILQNFECVALRSAVVASGVWPAFGENDQ